jgi:hypothetical protein
MTVSAFTPGSNLTTEAGDKLITEASDYLVTGMDLVWAVSAVLNGVPVDLSADVLLDPGIACRYGIFGSSPSDRVADTGTLTFQLNNSQRNSASLIGYYTPGHANCRAGWDLGVKVSLQIIYGGVIYYKFYGAVDEILPAMGIYRERRVSVTVVDWIDEAARYKLQRIPTAVNKYAGQLVSTIVNTMAWAPLQQSIAAGSDFISYALDTARDESTTAIRELQKICDNEFGYLYVRGDTAFGGKLVFEDRTTRQLNLTSLQTVTNAMTGLDAGRRRGDVINRAVVTVNPRAVSDSGNIILWYLPQVTKIEPGQTLTFSANYTDPDTQERTGATNLSYTFAFDSDPLIIVPGDMDASLNVTVSAGGNSALVTCANTGAVPGYLVYFTLDGVALYNYAPISFTDDNASSQAAYGLNMVNIDAPYHEDIGFAVATSSFVLSQWGTLQTVPNGLSLVGNVDATTMTAVLSTEPGDRITVTESMSAVSAQFIVHSVDFNILPGHIFTSTWTVAPVWVLPAPWLLGTAGYSELGTTTNLGF